MQALSPAKTTTEQSIENFDNRMPITVARLFLHGEI